MARDVPVPGLEKGVVVPRLARHQEDAGREGRHHPGVHGQRHHRRIDRAPAWVLGGCVGHCGLRSGRARSRRADGIRARHSGPDWSAKPPPRPARRTACPKHPTPVVNATGGRGNVNSAVALGLWGFGYRPGCRPAKAIWKAFRGAFVRREVLTKPGCSSTARCCRSGEQAGEEYARNRCHNAPQRSYWLEPGGCGSGGAYQPVGGAELPGS